MRVPPPRTVWRAIQRPRPSEKPRRQRGRTAIDIPNRSITLEVSDEELASRRVAEEAKGDAAWQATGRKRNVSTALQAYAALTTSAARGAVREVKRRSN